MAFATGKTASIGSISSTQNDKATPWFVTDIPRALEWVSDSNPENLCHGRFLEPAQVLSVPNPPEATSAATYVSSKGPTRIELHGISTLQDHVKVTQSGRILTADKAYVYRNSKGNLEWIRLMGHVDVEEHNHHVLATEVFINIKKNISHAYNVLYRVYQFFSSQNKYYNGWGRADVAERRGNNWWTFHHATYSTCAPTDKVWTLHSKKLTLDTDDGVGRAYHAYLTIKGVPVFYYPYVWFPLDNRRRTGFLYPTFGYEEEQGYFFSIPWYWNMAPNYDLTVTPRLMTERGILFQNEFRYLNHKGSGHIVFNVNPHDPKFSSYKNTILSEDYSPIYDAYVNALDKDSDLRYALSVQDDTQWSQAWISHLKINYVSDDYYMQDYNDIASDQNQLLNQFTMQYLGRHWEFTGLLEAYQTLHTFNGESTDQNQDQYRRLPELDFNGTYPNQFFGADLNLTAQAVNFAYSSDFSSQRPVGQRVHFQPSLSKPFNWTYGYIQPTISLDTTQYYSVKDFIADRTVSRSRTLPIFNLDSGLYFNRSFSWQNARYLQTLEPRLFYLYVPFKDQTDLPNFDTYLLPFTYDQLFAQNRYTGYDRLSNANQVGLSFTSRIISAEDASTKLSMSLGALYYFEPLKVQLNSNDSLLTYDRDNHWSPIVAQLNYYPYPHWSTNMDIAWNTEERQLDNGNISLNYNRDGKHVVATGYSYVYSNTRDNQGFSNSTNLFYVGAAWPVTYRWSAIGYFYFDFSQRISRNLILGLQYDACCWAVRLIGQRTYIGDEVQTTGAYQRQFKTGMFVQILLKGFGAFGSKRTSSDLLSSIPGYVVDF
jgi:LPS-assembly protein